MITVLQLRHDFCNVLGIDTSYYDQEVLWFTKYRPEPEGYDYE